MHPALTQAIVLAAISKLPESTKRQLTSKVQQRRDRAEEVLSASIVLTLSQRR